MNSAPAPRTEGPATRPASTEPRFSRWLDWVLAGKDREERRDRLAEVPQGSREAVRSYVLKAFHLKTSAEFKRARRRYDHKGRPRYPKAAA